MGWSEDRWGGSWPKSALYIETARPIWRRLLVQAALRAADLAEKNTVRMKAARMVMTAITTRVSMRVKPDGFAVLASIIPTISRPVALGKTGPGDNAWGAGEGVGDEAT